MRFKIFPVLLILIFMLFCTAEIFANDVFPYGWSPAGGTQTKKKNNISVNAFDMFFNGGILVEYEGLYIAQNISFTVHLLPIFLANSQITDKKSTTFGFGGGGGARYHFAPSLDGLFVGMGLSVYGVKTKVEDDAQIKLYRSTLAIPYAEVGYRFNFWDILSISGIFKLGFYAGANNIEYYDSSSNRKVSINAMYLGPGVMVGVTF